MPVRIFCSCGEDITETIPSFDRKTRTVYWFEQNRQLCIACMARADGTTVDARGRPGAATVRAWSKRH